MSHQPLTAPTASTVGPCPTMIQIRLEVYPASSHHPITPDGDDDDDFNDTYHPISPMMMMIMMMTSVIPTMIITTTEMIDTHDKNN